MPYVTATDPSTATKTVIKCSTDSEALQQEQRLKSLGLLYVRTIVKRPRPSAYPLPLVYKEQI